MRDKGAAAHCGTLRHTGLALLVIAVLAITALATAQVAPEAPAGQANTIPIAATQGGEPSSAVPPPEATSGREMGNYVVHQSIELGGRITDRTGSLAMYDTLVNLHAGPRVLEQTLSLQSRTQSGNFFDNLYASSFGWGGDPSNAARLRISKLRWYNFTVTFRRDKNYFDYDLFANPLNFPNATPVAVPDNFSPHSFFTTRRMYDLGLTLLPQRRVSFRLGYNRNRSEGPSFNTFHENTEPLLNQAWNNTLNAFVLGIDVKVLPKTTLSYTQNLQWAKIDTGYNLLPYNDWQLSTSPTLAIPSGIIASLGIPWQPSAGNPCSTPIVSLAAGLANPACNLYLNYTRTQRLRNFMPTEQLQLTSSSLRHLDFVGRFLYSSADLTNPMSEFFDGLVTRTDVRQWTSSDSVRNQWISVAAEFGVTVHLSNRVRLVDSFRFNNWRIPGTVLESLMYFYNAATVASPGNATLPIATFPTPLLHNLSSNPDLTSASISRFLKQDWKSNEIQLQADFSRVVGARLGYRYRHRTIADRQFEVSTDTRFPVFPPPTATTPSPCFGLPAPCVITTSTSGDEAELESFDFPEHTGIVGIWVRPVERMRFNFDAELTSSADIITRISPRHQQQYRGEFSYSPESWVNFGANFNLLERRNHDPGLDVLYDGHVRNLGFNVMLAPNDRLGLDIAYNYTGFRQDANVCYVGSGPTLVPIVSTGCVFGGVSATGVPLLREALGNFNSTTQFANFALRVKPVSRVSLSLGYGITQNDGSILTFNVLQPTGSLNSRWQTPLAAIGIGITKDLTFNTGWNYYQYDESDFVGPTAPRYFHSNIATLSLRYAF